MSEVPLYYLAEQDPPVSAFCGTYMPTIFPKNRNIENAFFLWYQMATLGELLNLMGVWALGECIAEKAGALPTSRDDVLASVAGLTLQIRICLLDSVSGLTLILSGFGTHAIWVWGLQE
jgi:hypothetical protein